MYRSGCGNDFDQAADPDARLSALPRDRAEVRLREAGPAALLMHSIGQDPIVIGVFLAGAVVSGIAWVWFARWLDRRP